MFSIGSLVNIIKRSQNLFSSREKYKPCYETYTPVFKKGEKGTMTGKFTTDDFQNDSLELGQEEEAVSVDLDYYFDIYKELAELIGVQNTKKVWNRYRGLTIQFPQRMCSPIYTKDFIRDNMDTMTIKDLAIQLNLTDRRVRQIIKELRRDNQ